jgi:CDP-4-dehydro-6-deoxyglucose reductase
MEHLLTVARAARLVGVARGTLQQRIKNGELKTFEGMVAETDLLHLYPSVRLDDDPVFERVNRIKEEAFAKRVRSHVLPDAEVLAARLFEMSRQMTRLESELARLRNFVHRIETQLGNGGEESELDWKEVTLRSWLGKELGQLASANGEAETLTIRDHYLRIMAAHVHLQPSGHDFFVDGSDTLLEAALKAGLAVNYGCSSGNCGQCRARVVSGQVMKTRAADYVIPDSEKNQGYILMCAHTAVTDAVLEAQEAGAGHEIPEQYVQTRVKRLDHVAPDTVVLHLQTPRSQRLRFIAGQKATLEIGHAPPAQFHIASCPCDDRNLQFHVRRIPDDPASEAVFESLRPNDPVQLRGPRGNFTLLEDSHRSLIFIACDLGFAPVKSLIEQAMNLEVAETLHLFWMACAPDGHYMANLCRAWADALDNFHPTLLAPPAGDGSQEAAARATATYVLHDCPDIGAYDVYLAGAPAFVDRAAHLLASQGLSENQLFREIIES